jgi:hypothetical protein
VTRLMPAGFELAHSHDADTCPLCEFLLAPIEEAASGPTLRGRDHLLRFARATKFINSIKKRLTWSVIFFRRIRRKNSMKIMLSDLMDPGSIRPDRRSFIGGSDDRIIMSPDEAALIRLWKEKRGEAEAEDLSGNLIVQLGVATGGRNRASRYFNRIPRSLSASAPVDAPRFPGEIQCPQLRALSAHRAELTIGSAVPHQRSQNVELWEG